MPATDRLAMGRQILLMGALLAAAACEADGDRERAAGPRAAANGALSVSDVAELTVGVLDGDPRYQFDGVVAAFFTTEGRLAVADRGSGQVRFYDETGQWVSAVGGEGEGPGEFRRLADAGPLEGGGVWTFDPRLDRFTYFDADGALVRTVTVASGGELYHAPQRLRDGSFVMQRAVSLRFLPKRSGNVRDTSAILRFSADGALIDTIAVAAGESAVVSEGPDGLPRLGVSYVRRGRSIAVSGDSVFVGTQDEAPVRVYSATGEVLGSLEPGLAEARLEESEVAALGYDPVDATLRPAFGRFLADPEGRLWINDASGLLDTAPGWTVVGPSGDRSARVVVPAGFRLLSVASGRLVGVQTDSLEVERVAVHVVH